MQTFSLCLGASLIVMASAGLALADDVNAGQEIYQAQCSPCHSDQAGVNGIGPSLAGLAERKAGSLPGFHFTPALQGSGLAWDSDTFIKFLADPSKLVPGTAMTVMVPDATGRANLFAYLATLKGAAETKPSGPAVEKISGPTQADLEGAAVSTDAWLYASHDYAGSRFVNLDQITPANAKDLRPVCLYRSEQSASVQTSPLVYRGVMYLTLWASHSCTRRQELSRALDLHLASQSTGDFPCQSWRSHQRWPAHPRNRRWLSTRHRHGRRLTSVESTHRQRGRRSISQHAATHL